MSKILSPLLLLAEDDRDSAFLFERVFKQVCPLWTFVCMPDGLAAREYIQDKGMPQVLVTDINMPRMDGYELIAWVRARGERLRVPVVVTSSQLDEETLRKCHELGADESVANGTRVQDLKAILKRFTDFVEKDLNSAERDGAG